MPRWSRCALSDAHPARENQYDVVVSLSPRIFNLLSALLLTAALCPAEDLPANLGRHVRFNDDWLFFKGEAAGAERPAFADSSWRRLTLPHDWAIEGPFDKRYNPETGGLPIYGTGWYRKHFTIPASEKGRLVFVEFDGAMSNARVWLNGVEIGNRPYGYSSFEVPLTAHLRWGADNVLAVRLTPEAESSRWYPGAGIYRNVWITVTDPVHVAHWGTYVTTPNVTEDKATVSIVTTIDNQTASPASVRVETSVADANGAIVARTQSDAA